LQDNPTYNPATSYPDEDGDKKLYLKGGEGSMAVINLFSAEDIYKYELLVDASGKPIDENGNLIPLESNGNPKFGYFLTYKKNNTSNGIPDELDEIRFPLIDASQGQIYHSIKKRSLINEAKLVFHIDTDAMGVIPKPQRIYLYDMTNNIPISDYFSDFTSGTNSKNGKLIFDGILNKTKSTYTIRITNHIRNLINDATKKNVKLGVVVTEDINSIDLSEFRDKTSFAPKASVMNPLGTILYGSKSTVPEDKRLKLEIYYTKPN
jgi:hypothetical protein